MRRRSSFIAILATAVALGLLIPLSLPAAANVTGGITGLSTSIFAGDATSGQASFTIGPPGVGSNHVVEITVTPVGGVTGTATLSLDGSNGLDSCLVGSGGTVIVCDWSSGGNGDNGTVDFTLDTSSDAMGTWRVAAFYDDNNTTGDPVGTPVDVIVSASADLSTTKADSPDPVLPGASLTYTVGYVNNGPSDASGVTVIDALPAEVTFVSATPDQGTCIHSVGVVTCDVGSLTASASGQIEIMVTVGSSVAPGTTLTNNATVSSITTPDPDTSNNAAMETTTVPEIADLEISKSDNLDPVLPSANLIYTIGYANNGPSTASAVEVVDVLPAEVIFVSATPDQGICSEASGVVNCDIGTLGSGANGQVSIAVTVSPSAVPGSEITNNASITSNPATVDPNTDNNATSEDTTIQAVADMSIGKGDDFDPVPAGTQLTYTIGYDNLGVSDATAVEVVDTLPAGVTLVSVTPDQGTCSEAAGVVTCDLGDVAAAASAGQILIVVHVDASTPSGATLTNTATISSDIVDQVPGNDTTVETTEVIAVADLSMGKADADDPVMAGDQVLYTLTYENIGPPNTTGVEVVDTLPAGVTFVSATPDQGTCSQASDTVTCGIGALSVGESGQIFIVVDVPADSSPRTISNTATISSDVTDPESTNDTATEDTTVGGAADLSITKVGTPDPVIAGDNVTYMITYSNAGPSDAIDVVVTDTLAAGVIFVSTTPGTGTCSEASGLVTCMLGDLTPGSGGSIQIVVSIPSDTPSGSITNQVAVASATTDPTPGDNATVATVEVAAEGTTSTTTPPSTTTSTTPTTTTAPSTTTTVDIDDLPLTGQDMRLLVAVGLSMLLSGLLVLARRRTGSG